MQNTKRHHPTEDELERFILNRSTDEELEDLEVHILACESCVTRLEDLELQIRATKVALQDMRREELAKAALPEERSWKAWLAVPNWLAAPKFSLAGAVVAVALGVIIIPAFLPQPAPVAQVSLSAYRGEESSIVPAGHRLELHLNTTDLAEGPVLASVVDLRGAELWKGTATIHHERADVRLPPINGKGAHFLRLYAPTEATSDSGLLREFAFQVQ
ncbi:MAG: hypothetical protein ACJ74Z_11520 [Bryobacteraceae bacterium]